MVGMSLTSLKVCLLCIFTPRADVYGQEDQHIYTQKCIFILKMHVIKVC